MWRTNLLQQADREFKIVHPTAWSTDKRKHTEMVCSRCRTHEYVRWNRDRDLPDIVIANKLKERGWKLGGKSRQNDVCPKCMGVHQENLLANKYRVIHGHNEVKPAAKFAEAEKFFRNKNNGHDHDKHLEAAKVEVPSSSPTVPAMIPAVTDEPTTPAHTEERGPDFREAILAVFNDMKTKLADQGASTDLILEQLSEHSTLIKRLIEMVEAHQQIIVSAPPQPAVVPELPAPVAAIDEEPPKVKVPRLAAPERDLPLIADVTTTPTKEDVTISRYVDGIQIRVNRDLWEDAGFHEIGDRFVLDIEEDNLVIRFPDEGERSSGIWMKNGSSVYMRSTKFHITQTYNPDIIDVVRGEILLSLGDPDGVGGEREDNDGVSD